LVYLIAKHQSMTLKLAIAGAGGRMGRVLTRVVHETKGCEIAGGLEAKGSPHIGVDMGVLAGLGVLSVLISEDAAAVLKHVDGIIDFTVPAATLALLQHSKGKIHVIGTTGFDDAGNAQIGEAAKSATIMKTGNYSLGVNILENIVKKVAAALGEEFDIEILEMHHRHKIDAPSGTALLLGQAAADGRQISLKDHSVRSRDGHTGARKPGDIGFATLRGGSVVGDHTVMFTGTAERIELVHRAESRDIFAYGAVKAALWCKDKKPGLYNMNDVLGLN
jgi:4-hydroxy-tetrahydrodipicolinate reductase